MQELYDEIVQADGLIFGTPIYFWGMTGQAKTVMDRTIALNQPGRNMTNKVAGAVRLTCRIVSRSISIDRGGGSM